MKLSDETFDLYAAKYYDNPGCQSIEEFEEDLRRFKYLKKLFNRYERDGDLKERLILNHLIVIFNCFGENAIQMLFFKFEDLHGILKPFLQSIYRLPKLVSYNNVTIDTDSIISDKIIAERLNRLC